MGLTHLLSWLIAGTMACWLAHEMAGRGSMGLAVDWLVGLVGAMLAVFILPFITWLVTFIVRWGNAAPLDWWQRIVEFPWWYAVPTAFVGGLLLTALFRRVSRSSP